MRWPATGDVTSSSNAATASLAPVAASPGEQRGARQDRADAQSGRFGRRVGARQHVRQAHQTYGAEQDDRCTGQDQYRRHRGHPPSSRTNQARATVARKPSSAAATTMKLLAQGDRDHDAGRVHDTAAVDAAIRDRLLPHTARPAVSKRFSIVWTDTGRRPARQRRPPRCTTRATAGAARREPDTRTDNVSASGATRRSRDRHGVAARRQTWRLPRLDSGYANLGRGSMTGPA